jgi:hypothetical protein
MILLVISFFLAAAICSSYLFVAFAAPNVYYSKPVCRVTSQTPTQTNQTCCYTKTTTYPNGRTTEQDYCYDCFKTTTMNDFVCGSVYTPRTSIGTTNPLPPSIGPVQPPSTPPRASNETSVNNLPGNIGTVQSPSTLPSSPSNALPSPSSALPSQLKQQQPTTTTNTCHDGSTPDANSDCPSANQQQTAPNQNLASNNNHPQQGHHHKGSNNNLQGGQESTSPSTTKKGKGSKTS